MSASSRRVDDDPAVSFDGPLGIRATVRGSNLIAAVLGIAFVGSTLYFLWYHNQEMEMANAKLIQKLDEVVYVVSLPPEKRDSLNLSEPDSLRQKQRHWRDSQ